MSQNNLKFFTNEPERDLYSRFNKVLKTNTQFFDVIVGYFRTSGFFRLYESLEDVERIRILVGINTDKFTVKLIDQARGEIEYATLTRNESVNIISETVEKEFEYSDTSQEIEKGVRTFIDWLKSGKLEMRMYTKAPIHAKVYIMRKDPEKADYDGSVITGSSNFSEAGLINNLEFNVELREPDELDFAQEKFNELWNDSEDIKDVFIDTVQNRTWMRDDITPYYLYIKTLYEYFDEEINEDKESYSGLVPEGYMTLQYQLDAVTQAKKKLESYGGVFISDVVGLGKTYICAMLANTFSKKSRKLFVCPPVLKEYWEDVLKEFGVTLCDVVSLGKLDSILQSNHSKYDYVFVDEAHRFRNNETASFSKLHEICYGKKIILISATPINNYTSDIEHQLYLFQSRQCGNINGIKNLESFFKELRGKLDGLEPNSQEYIEQSKKNSEIIRDRLLREVMVRRTRSEIEQYYKDDLEKQGLKFPRTGSPEKIIYEFDEETDKTFRKTIEIIRSFKYSRYTPLLYLKDTSKYGSLKTGQRNMGGFMKGTLIKRLESSFHAFRKSISRFIDSYERFIAMTNKGEIFISKEFNVYDLLDEGDFRKLLYLVEEGDVMNIDMEEFRPDFVEDLNEDLEKLKYLQKIWEEIDVDPKLDEFKKNLRENETIKGNKIIVFTESKETAEYLCDNLKDIYGDAVIYYSSESSKQLKLDIEDSFNPDNKDNNNDKFDVLITTDVLAEGVNLHRSNVLINYDLPWNPTRIMQRVGRINRVGSQFDQIHVFNFFPTAQSEKHLPQEDRILLKLQAFHEILGEDYQYLSEDEVVSPKKLFDDLNKNIDDEEENTNQELGYLSLIRKIRDDNSELFETIKRIPKKAKTGRKTDVSDCNYTIGFIKKGALKTFFKTGDDTEQVSFLDAIQQIESNPDEPIVSVGRDYYDHFKKNSTAFDNMIKEEDIVTTDSVSIRGNDNQVIRYLKAMKNDSRFTDKEEETIDILIKRFEEGEIPRGISKEAKEKTDKKNKDVLELYRDITKVIPKTYYEERHKNRDEVEAKKEVVLSCYFSKLEEENE